MIDIEKVLTTHAILLKSNFFEDEPWNLNREELEQMNTVEKLKKYMLELSLSLLETFVPTIMATQEEIEFYVYQEQFLLDYQDMIDWNKIYDEFNKNRLKTLYKYSEESLKM